MSPHVIETRAQMRARPPQGERAVVMTMGALHEGHAALLAEARRRVGPAGEVVATVFVNPLQFGPDEDYERYPRTWASDLAVCREHGVDLVFAPTAADMYAAGRDITIDPGPLGEILEGAARAGHFSGMLTVVIKLLNLTRPTVALFGEKDYQQLVLIRRMAAVLDLAVAIEGCATVREPDGLALSSRNRYLDTEHRRTARAIPDAIAAATTAAEAGATGAEVVAAAEALLAERGVTADYVALTDPELGPAPDRGEARLLLAARVGTPRLIDNAAITLEPR